MCDKCSMISLACCVCFACSGDVVSRNRVWLIWMHRFFANWGMRFVVQCWLCVTGVHASLHSVYGVYAEFRENPWQRVPVHRALPRCRARTLDYEALMLHPRPRKGKTSTPYWEATLTRKPSKKVPSFGPFSGLGSV